MPDPIFNNGFDLSQATCTIAGVPCAEGVRDYLESADRSSGPDLSKTYFCEWTRRFTVANACLGLTTISGGRGGTITFNRPLQHPEIPSCYSSSIRIAGKGRPFPGPYQVAWPVAAITVGFRAFPWSFGGFDDPEGLQNFSDDANFVYATQEIDQGEETMEIPGSALKYAGGRLLNKPMSIPFAHAILRITFLKMPYLPVATLPYYNHTNATTFLGCPAETVKFKGTQTHRDFNSIGPPSQTVTNTYHYRALKAPGSSTLYGWNYEVDPDAATFGSLWKLVTFSDSASTKRFPPDDLTQTFPNLSYLGDGS